MAGLVLVPVLLLSLAPARELAAVPGWLAGLQERGFASVVARLAAAAGDVGRSLLAVAVVFASLLAFYRNGGLLGPMRIRIVERLGGQGARATLAPLGETVRGVLYGLILTAPAQGILRLSARIALAGPAGASRARGAAPRLGRARRGPDGGHAHAGLAQTLGAPEPPPAA